MSIWSNAVFRLRALVRRSHEDRALSDEVAFHLHMQARQLEADGWAPAAAAAEARRRFGLVGREIQRAKDSWGITGVLAVLSDVRLALRQLWRRPAFTVMGVGTLALGLGATVAFSSVALGLLVRPLPVTDESRLQVFWSDFNWRGVEFDFVKARQRAFSGLAAYSNEGYTLRVNDQSSTVLATVGSAELFDVLGAQALMGRTFQPGDDRPGASPVVVVSHGFWQQELGGDPAVLGRRLEIDGAPVEVVGVMPRGFYFPSPMFRIWRPLTLDPASDNYQGNGWLVLVGRERVGLSRGELTADVEAIAQALGERFEYPEAWDKTKGAAVTPLRDYTRGTMRRAVLLLQAAVVLVLGIACANVAALVLARTTDRAGELGLRAALGAGRGRLVRQIVVESLTMSTLSAAAGVAVAGVGFRFLVARLPLTDGLEETLGLDWTFLALAIGLSLLVGVVVAVVPVRALIAGRLDGIGHERSAAGGAPMRTGRTHHLLIVSEVALAVLLVTGAATFTRAVNQLFAIDPGFDVEHVAAMDLVAPGRIMAGPARREAFAQTLERVSALPGVAAAGLVTRLPLRDGGWQGTVIIEDRPDLRDGREPNALFRPVSPGYFSAMGISIVQGRGPAASDAAGAPPVAVVSQSFADTMWPGRSPLGRRIQHTFDGDGTWVTVVGVTEETRQRQMTGDNPLVLYVPMAQTDPPESPILVVKGERGAPPVAAVIAAVRAVESRIAIGRVTSLDAVLAGAVAEPLRLRFFLTVFGALALVIGVAGIYSVVSYAVVRRHGEFGVRLALGASPGQIVAGVLGRTMWPVGVGVIVGLAGAAAIGSTVRGVLEGVAPADAVSLAAAAAVLLLAGLVGGVVPAMRAGRIDPAESLRTS